MNGVACRIRDTQHFKILRTGAEYFLWKVGPFFSSVNQLIAHYRRNPVSAKEHAFLADMHLVRIVLFLFCVLLHFFHYDDLYSHEAELKSKATHKDE